MITIEDVSFGYTKDCETLRQIDLQVSPGECILLCGESGCGKTTITKLVNGLIPQFTEGCSLTGSVTAAGMSVPDTELYELAKRVGSVFQNPKSQFFNLDSDSELAFGLENQGAAPAFIRERLKATIHNLGIESLTGRNIFAMSGGEKQTLAFASVYAMNPSIYVLDEPSANLDETAIDRLREQISVLKAEGRTILVAEHRLYYVRDLIDRAVYMKSGEMIRSFTGDAFRGLSDRERRALGLRTLTATAVDIPPALPAGETEGLSVENLTCGFKKDAPVLEDLSFSARAGEVLAVSGQNGVGKTTLARCLCGLLKERSGAIKLDGSPLKPKERSRAAFCVMQDVNHQLFSDSVRGECELAAPHAAPVEIETILEHLQLLLFREQHPMALSGGQKQRLAVATAMLSHKKILVFDEPTSGLDYMRMQSVAQMIRRLAKEGHIILVVTHDKEFLQSACDRVLEL